MYSDARPKTAPVAYNTPKSKPTRLMVPGAMESSVQRLSNPRRSSVVSPSKGGGGLLPGEVSPTKLRESITKRSLKPDSGLLIANRTSYELDPDREERLAERRKAIYTRHASKPYHHDFQGDPHTVYDNGKVMRGGKAMVGPPHAQGTYDPIKGAWTVPHEAGQFFDMNRPSTAFSPLKVDHSGRLAERDMDRRLTAAVPYPESIGKYDPLTHEWIIPPRGEKFLDRETKGRVQRKGMVPLPPDFGKYDPMCHEWIVPPSDDKFLDRGKHRVGYRSVGASSKKIVTDHWNEHGRFDPVKGEWVKEPENLRYGDLQQARPSTGKKMVPLPDKIGRYDPVKNEWLLPPKDQRVHYGLARGDYTWREHLTGARQASKPFNTSLK